MPIALRAADRPPVQSPSLLLAAYAAANDVESVTVRWCSDVAVIYGHDSISMMWPVGQHCVPCCVQKTVNP